MALLFSSACPFSLWFLFFAATSSCCFFRFMVLDASKLYTQSRLNALLTTRTCTNDTDCPILDCLSQCNLTTGYCTGRINHNVQVSLWFANGDLRLVYSAGHPMNLKATFSISLVQHVAKGSTQNLATLLEISCLHHKHLLVRVFSAEKVGGCIKRIFLLARMDREIGRGICE